VKTVVDRMKTAWAKVDVEFRPDANAPHEARLLKLDCAKAKSRLGWKPVWSGLDTVEITAAWYRAWTERAELRSRTDIERYVRDARAAGIEGI
jgi:CDP-glucose 4,6-dehydratase